jgi:Na+/H+-dicarboxylate symporter
MLTSFANLMGRNLPLQLLGCLVIGGLFGNVLSDSVISWFYTASVLIKDILMFVLPAIIFSYLLAALAAFEKQAPLLILSVFLLIIFSNAIGVLTSYSVACLSLSLIGEVSAESLVFTKQVIHPVFDLNIKPFIIPEIALIAGILAGLVLGFLPLKGSTLKIKSNIFKFRDWITSALTRCFIPLLPIYILGFVFKLQREGTLAVLLENYSKIFIIVCVLIIVYISFLYLLASNFHLKRCLGYLREMVPAGLTAFSTMSSAATMPLTLAATEKNLNDREYADFIIPTTVNNHMVGDSLSIPLTALSLLVMSGQPMPDIHTYLSFVLYYCLAKFSAAGVPGGGVIVILPVIQAHLGLNETMTSLLATIYILKDPILTATNVMGNGAFALLSRKAVNFLYRGNTCQKQQTLQQ